MDTLKKQKSIRGDVKETDKYWWRRLRNRHILVETLKKRTNIGGDVKVTDKYPRRREKTDKYWWRR